MSQRFGTEQLSLAEAVNHETPLVRDLAQRLRIVQEQLELVTAERNILSRSMADFALRAESEEAPCQ